MSAKLATPHTVRASHPRTRTALAVAGVTAAIAAGGLTAARALFPDESGRAQGSEYVPSDQAVQSMSNTLAAEYRIGLTTAPSHDSASKARVLRQLRHSVANQYGGR